MTRRLRGPTRTRRPLPRAGPPPPPSARLFAPWRSVWRYHGVWRGPRMLFVARVTRVAEGNRGGGCRAAMVTNPVHGLPFLPGSSFTDSTVRASRKGSPLRAPPLSSITQAPPPSCIPASAGFARSLGSPHTLWVLAAVLFLLSYPTYPPSGPITPGHRLSLDSFLPSSAPLCFHPLRPPLPSNLI